MSKAKAIRIINKNLFWGKLHLKGLVLDTLGKKLNPPVSRFRLSQIINNATPDYRLKEIAKILDTNVGTLFPRAAKEGE